MSSSRTRWVLACAAGILLSGCDDGPSAAAPAPSQTSGKAPTPEAPLPPAMVAAVSSARNSHVVGVHFVLNGTPTVRKPLPVDIAIVPHEPVISLNVHFEAHDGLTLATGNVLERQADPHPGEIIKHQLVLLPAQEGVFVVTAIVETETAEGSVSRVFSIPVIVGAPGAAAAAPAAAPTPATQPTGG